ncbi:MAG TPA: hypothetical protein DGP25_05675 [Brevundimonas sp.]|nr:hypothetical protein [Brevundimonas sp.]HCW49508.1 hypothetical protein [Brevundimonas sp.]
MTTVAPSGRADTLSVWAQTTGARRLSAVVIARRRRMGSAARGDGRGQLGLAVGGHRHAPDDGARIAHLARDALVRQLSIAAQTALAHLDRHRLGAGVADGVFHRIAGAEIVHEALRHPLGRDQARLHRHVEGVAGRHHDLGPGGRVVDLAFADEARFARLVLHIDADHARRQGPRGGA